LGLSRINAVVMRGARMSVPVGAGDHHDGTVFVKETTLARPVN